MGASKQHTTEQWKRNKRKFDRLTIGSFVKLTPDGEPGEIYTVKKKYTEHKDGYIEHFIDVSTPSGWDSYTLQIGHMDRDATKLRIISIAPSYVDEPVNE